MGLDVALGIVILLAAVRGWLKGFLHQVVRIGALIACVFLADPVRSEARPHVAPFFPSIQPAMLDRILWWLACGLTYMILVGAASLLIALARRPDETGVVPAMPNDRFAGFILGAAKGLLVAILIAAGVQKYALSQLRAVPWAAGQIEGSKALAWNELYRPVPLIWESSPVRRFVARIQQMGMPEAVAAGTSAGPTSSATPPAAAPAAGRVADRAATAAKTDQRTPRLSVGGGGGADAVPLGAAINGVIEDVKARLKRAEPLPNQP